MSEDLKIRYAYELIEELENKDIHQIVINQGNGKKLIYDRREKAQWIPCSDRFPEDDTPVLVYLFESNSPYIAWVSDCEWFTEEFQIEKDSEPKAWMPLPDAYEVDK